MSASAKWRNFAVFHLVARDGNVCRFCGVELTPEPGDGVHLATSRTVDHLVPLSSGGTGHWRNLGLACHGCNNLKASMTADQFASITVENPRPIPFPNEEQPMTIPPPYPTFTLDPASAEARELARLWDLLLSASAAEHAAHSALSAAYRTVDGGVPDLTREPLADLFATYNAREEDRRNTYFDLFDAVCDAAGNPRPDEAAYWRPGAPLFILRAGDRLHAVTNTSNPSHDPVRDYSTMTELAVIDL